MENKDKSTEVYEIIEELRDIEELLEENPCGMNASTMRDIVRGIKALLGKECKRELNMEQVCRYFGVDARTVRRWRKDYEDFPPCKVAGENELSVSADKIVAWGRKHNKRKTKKV